jgi:rSAM/selenodomain-associated transferase 1
MKSSALPADRVRVAVFAKAPVPGQVKTRLAAELGDEGAAALHATLVRQALATAMLAGIGRIELWCAPDAADPFFAQCARETGARLRVQQGRDLGERMSRAFDDAFDAGRHLVLIGSDCPALTPECLQDAAVALASHDAVIVPAEDGGYVLVGLSRTVRGLFDGISWSTGEVMASTRERLAAAGARWKELPPLWDVDRPEDYARLRREGWLEETAS